LFLQIRHFEFINVESKDAHVRLIDKLSGILAKSGPLDCAIKNSFPLFFVCEKVLVHRHQNHFIYFPILYFRFATSQKPILPATGFRR